MYITFVIPARLPDNIRSNVIQQWLAGYQRDRIAFDCGISAGAVSSITSDWKMAVDSYDPDASRDLGVALNKIGISHVQCAIGLRVATMLRRFGVKENQFESFLSDIHNRCCHELGLTAERIVFYIANVAKLSDNMPISEIPNYILQKVDEKKRIEQKIKNWNLRLQICEVKSLTLKTVRHQLYRTTRSHKKN